MTFVGESQKTIMTLPEAIVALSELKGVLEYAGIEYMVVGSLASSIHGLPRATRDADLVVLINYPQVKKLIAGLGARFYMSEDAAIDAIRHGTSFNIIHEETFFQVDLFVMKPTPFNKEQFERREYVEIDPERSIAMPFQSAEDTILSKLDWFRQGREVSERQWQDVIGILRAQGNQLNLEYLHRWAANLSVDDLLQRALEEYWPQSSTAKDDL
jgi:hypothetical protein